MVMSRGHAIASRSSISGESNTFFVAARFNVCALLLGTYVEDEKRDEKKANRSVGRFDQSRSLEGLDRCAAVSSPL